MEQLPVFLNVRGWPCLVVGAGPVGAGRARCLPPPVRGSTWSPPDVGERAAELQQGGLLEEIRTGRFEESDLDGCRLVVAATGAGAQPGGSSPSPRRGASSRTAPRKGGSDISPMPAIVDRSPVLAAVSTGGASPSLARYVRARLETLIPRSFGRLAELAASFARRSAGACPGSPTGGRSGTAHSKARSPRWRFAGRLDDARAALRAALECRSAVPRPSGEVYLVGAGPGDPDLLTFRAMRLMQQADVVVHDRLVSPGVLALARRDAERIIYDRASGAPSTRIRQPDINRLLVRLAPRGQPCAPPQGRRPVRLRAPAARRSPRSPTKGSVPGGSRRDRGAPAAPRMPAFRLPTADHAHACVFVTGNRKERKGRPSTGRPVARPGQTIVIYMGLSGLGEICAGLVAHGLDASTPAALVQQGTTETSGSSKEPSRLLAARVAGAVRSTPDPGDRGPRGAAPRQARLVPAPRRESTGAPPCDPLLRRFRVRVMNAREARLDP